MLSTFHVTYLAEKGASYEFGCDRHTIKTVPSQLDGSSLIGLPVLSVGGSLSGSLAQPLRATADYSKLLPAIAKYYSRRCADQAGSRRTRWIENPDNCMVCVLSSYILGFYVVLSTSLPFLLSYVQFDMFSEPHHLLFPQHFTRFSSTLRLTTSLHNKTKHNTAENSNRDHSSSSQRGASPLNSPQGTFHAFEASL